MILIRNNNIDNGVQLLSASYVPGTMRSTLTWFFGKIQINTVGELVTDLVKQLASDGCAYKELMIRIT